MKNKERIFLKCCEKAQKKPPEGGYCCRNIVSAIDIFLKFDIYIYGSARYTEAAPYGVCRARQER